MVLRTLAAQRFLLFYSYNNNIIEIARHLPTLGTYIKPTYVHRSAAMPLLLRYIRICIIAILYYAHT